MSRASRVLPLSRVPIGVRCVIASVDGPARAELEREGVLPGSLVRVAARTPLGGPVILELGRARIAVSSLVAAQVLTEPSDTDPSATAASGAGPLNGHGGRP